MTTSSRPVKTLLACLLSALVVAPTVAPLPVFAQTQTQELDRIAAVVNEDVVLRSELDRAVANIRSQYAGKENQLPPQDVLERQVLERLILTKLQVARAQETGIRVNDEEVDQAIAAVAQQNGVSVDQLRQRVTADGSSYADFRTSIREELLLQRLRQRFAQSRVNVSEAEIESALAASAKSGKQYHLAHILVSLPDGATAEQIETAQKKVDGIKALIGRGEMDFKAAAVRYSDSPNALEGGDLGWRAADEIPSAFAALVNGLQPGQVTDPIRGPSGFQLLQLVEVRDASSAPAQMVTQYHGRHILIRVGGGKTDDQAHAEADTLAARLAGGADFAELAKANSQDQNSAGKGGDLGWFTADEFGPEFRAQVTLLNDNGISKPFRTQAGWHVLQRLGSRESNVGDQNRRAQVAETLGRRKLEDQWNLYLRELRGEAYVDVRVGAAAPATAPATPPAPASGG
ncbi:molecular chaperone SurA [Lysobacter sp. TY2-98]|uniref:peptidylprolyl isomerase n=1 Tax=Lysobacter sp. TY2-98 TaxID=2290922 RepID=UPI000E2062C9|nr:peptidylprolyl isomerase [Lysobacter sp. TY2-98]AXK71114.1 molecular chaperone SurA [Lysobacter sp. TY2-98]